MSRHTYTSNYGVPSVHPSHTNSSNVMGRQAANPNKYEQVQTNLQTNSNKYEQQQTQQQQLQQQQKNKLVSTEYPMSGNHQSASHQHAVPMPHNSFRVPTSNYHVTSPNLNYQQSVPPQTAHQTSERPIIQLGQAPQQQPPQTQVAQQHSQDHKMQQQSSSQQPHPQSNLQYHQGQFGRQQQPANYRNIPNQNRVSRQPNVQQQQPNVVPAHPTNAAGTQPLLAANNMMVQRLQFVNFNNSGQQFYGGYSQQIPYYYPVQAHQSTDTSGYAIPINSIQSNSHLQNHRQPPHQQMNQPIAMAPPTMNHSYMLTQMQRPKDQGATKRKRNPLSIIDPKTQAPINLEDKNNSGSNTHSSALKIESPPSAAHNQIQSESQSTQPPNSRTMPSAQSTSDGSAILSNEIEQTTCDPNYASTEHQMDNEEPPTTPIVSAIADGPSVDITPKQSKNYKRTNKSPEWPVPSTDKLNTDSSTCDNTTKVASTTLNATSSGSNEWVKPNATKVGAEASAKEQTIQSHQPQHKHHQNQKSKQTGSNQYTQPKSKALPFEAPANVHHHHQQQQQQQQQQQPTQTSAPQVTATTKEQIVVINETKLIGSSKSAESSSSSSSKIETASNVTIQTKHSEKPNQQPKHTIIEKSSSNSASTKEQINVTSMSSGGSSNIRVNASVQKAETAADLNIKGSKPETDETDKVIKSLESMAITETNAEKNDKLDAELVKGGSGQSKVNETTSAPLKTDIVGFESNNNSHKAKQPLQDTASSQPKPQPQKSDTKKSDKQVIENDLTHDASANETTNPSSTTNSSVNTKDSKTVPIETSTDNGLAEQLNNIKNNNLTNSTGTVTAKTPTTSTNNQLNNNNNIMDKDLDNNPVAETATATAASTATTTTNTSNSSSTQNQEDANSADQSQSNAQQPINKPIQNAKPKTLPNHEKSEVTAAPQDGAVATAENENALLAARQTKLTYGEGQWSPDNLEGRKYYDRNQLVQLRDTNIAKEKPQIANNFHHLFKATNSNYASNSNNNNNKNQSSSSNARNNQYNQRPSKQGCNQQMQQGGGKGSRSGMIHLSLLLNKDVKLNEATNAWKPTFISGGSASNGPSPVVESQDLDNIEVLCKRVRGILNKLTPEKFEPLLKQLQALNINTNEKLSAVISLVFEKAIDEPHFSSAYAQLCQQLSKPLEDKKDSGDSRSIFKKELLTKCQNEFQTHVADENSINSKLLPMQQELSSSTDENRKMELNVLIEEEERKLRRRSVGTVRFIGELYRQDMLLTRIMEWCVITLLNIPTEEKLECLCKLLTTVGQKMETRTGDAETDKKYYRDLTPHFASMQNIASDKKQNKVSSRVRFMLMDVIELRKNKWISRRTDSNPKKMGQIQKEAEQEQYKQMLNNMTGSGMGGNNMGRKDNRDRDRDRNDRGSMRGDSRGGSMSGGGYMNNNNSNKLNRGNYHQDNDGWIQQGSNKGRSSNNSTVDPSKFFRASTTKEDLTNTSLGAANQFQWNRMNQQAPTNITNSFSALEPEYKPMSGSRSKEPYHSKGSMERERGSVSRSGSQHGSRDSSAARNSYSSRSLQQMRPPQMQYNTLPMNSSSSSQNRLRSDKIESTSSSTSNLLSLASISGSSSDPKLSEAISDETVNAIRGTIKEILPLVQHDDLNNYGLLDDAMEAHKIQFRWAVVRELYNLAVDTSGLNETKRCSIGTICAYWFDNNLITKQDYIRALSEIISNLEDIAIDVPKIYEYIIPMISAPVFNNIMTINDLKDTAEESRSKVLGSLLTYLAYAYGPQYVRNLWKRSKCKFSDFVPNDEVEKFVEKYKLKFVENCKETLAPVTTPISDNHLRNRIRQLIRRKDFSGEEEIVDYIKFYVPKIDKQSIRLLTTTLVEGAIDKNKDTFTLNETYLPRSIQIIKALADGEDEQKNFQLESLYAIQMLSHDLEHPSGFLITIFNKLYEDDDLYDVGVFKAWSTSKEQIVGKGVALKNLNNFFKFLEENNEESDVESGE